MGDKGELLIFIVKLVLGGFAAFFAILLWSKTREFPWMVIVIGTITQYAGILYDLLCYLGIINVSLFVFEIPLVELIFSVLPPLFYIMGFVSMLHRSGR